MIRLVIVDKSNTQKKNWQISLQNKPDLKIVGFVHDGQAAIHYIEKTQPDIVLMNINLPIMDGLTTTRIISQHCPDTQVVLVTTKDSRQELNQVLQVGGRGYLLNSTKIQEIINVVRLVDQGYFYIDSSLAQKYIFKKSAKKYVVSKKKQHKIIHKPNKNSFLSELQAIRCESQQINLVLKKVATRLKFWHNFSFSLILIILTLMLAIIWIVQ